jgi:hypothetical protein
MRSMRWVVHPVLLALFERFLIFLCVASAVIIVSIINMVC